MKINYFHTAFRWCLRFTFFPVWVFFIFRRDRQKRYKLALKSEIGTIKSEVRGISQRLHIVTVEKPFNGPVTPPKTCYACEGCGSKVNDSSIKLCSECEGTGKVFFWFNEPIVSLDDGHLFNIIEAMNRGTWLKTGNPVQITPDLRYALRKEAKKRKWKGKQKVGFRQRNLRFKELRSNYPSFIEHD